MIFVGGVFMVKVAKVIDISIEDLIK